MITLLAGKIHRAVVTQAELDYVGSITIDAGLMKAAGIFEYQKVDIADVENGQRFSTYVIAGKENSGIICLNGATARLAQVGDKIIIMAYGLYDESSAAVHKPQVVLVDEKNKITKIAHYEKHGRLLS
ncbi:aspartate 1-decarboxylase [Oenococcus alcoholitolerans]|uniref:aspartate 1-decarboxylase n=1 Tax=Oenococcus alcoholitolerans TaxID=931074 RepID=UPI003F72ADE2